MTFDSVISSSQASHLARIVRIPSDQQDGFTSNIREALWNFIIHAGWAIEHEHNLKIERANARRTRSNLSRLRRKALALQQNLIALDENARSALGLAIVCQIADDQLLHDESRRAAAISKTLVCLETLTGNIGRYAAIAEIATGETALGYGPPLVVGAQDKLWPFDRFVYDVVQTIYIRGGRATVDKNLGSGTLVEFLRAVRPNLPLQSCPGFIVQPSDPTMCGLDRLERIRQVAAKNWIRYRREIVVPNIVDAT